MEGEHENEGYEMYTMTETVKKMHGRCRPGVGKEQKTEKD
jgi:hypothetical protein